MTTTQKILVRQSTLRSEIGVALGITESDRPDSWSTDLESLSKRLQELEIELRAAMSIETVEGQTVEKQTDTGSDNLRELERRADIGQIFEAVIRGGPTAGAEAELQAELGMAGNQIPIGLLQRDDSPDLEIRTTGVTPVPSNLGRTQQKTIPFVFPMGSAAFLRIPQPTVGVGESVFTVIATAATVQTPAKGAEAAHSTAGFTAMVLSPSRIQASLFYAREDVARLKGIGESLRANLEQALSDKLDREILQGSTNGLLTGTNLAHNNASSADDFASYRKRFAYDNVDGSYASTASELRLLTGTTTYSDMAATYRGTNSDLDALSSLARDTGGVRVSGNMVAAASNKQNAIVRRGGRMDAVAPIWDGITVLVDEVTQAKAGEVVLTAILLHAFKVLREDGFRKVQAQVS